jgi:hypothetical protein
VAKTPPLLGRISDFAAFLDERFDEDAAFALLRRAETVGGPFGGRLILPPH